VNEKSVADDSSKPGTGTGTGTTDPEKVAMPLEPSGISDNPSPVLPPGDTPFPSFDGASQANSARFLDPQHQRDKSRERRTTFSPLEKPVSRDSTTLQNAGSVRRRRRATTKGSRGRGVGTEDLLTPVEAEELLSLTRGNLVQFPYDWLATEEGNSNWGYHLDGMAPIII
jgi:phospholipase D1/2